ncbi:hypothetical protein [Plantactinospora sp. BB1]|uniref:hypothetical protein n=1 Tax=Plantactinospora sp. BB1 TaxID=2071627 RepID=UPI000D155BCD|nr:hypothetical protein [Plantactinospora sp. BB1]AVT35638.1 hypothetical protein C6W10_03270 [Plantactinospora sp. BB1]
MRVDEEVRRTLAEMTEELRPVPDPYARVLARHRRIMRRRAVAAGLAVVAVLTATGVAVASTDTGRRGTPDGGTATAKPSTPEETRLAWVERLVQSPPRGSLGADRDYVAALSQQVRQEQAAGRFAQLTGAMRDIRVLYVDDVGPHRVAFVAFVRAEPEPQAPQKEADHVGRWLVAEAGATPQVLGDPSRVEAVSVRLMPHEQLTLRSEVGAGGLYHVSIVPDGCRFATAARATLTSSAPPWTPEPTGSYLVRPPNTLRNEWWQITCDGVVRQRLPAPRSALRGEFTEAALDRTISAARGTPDVEHARSALRESDSSLRTHALALPSLVWGGRTAGTPGKEYDGVAAVVAGPLLGGGWTGMVNVRYAQPRPDGSLGSPLGYFSTDTDPTDPRALLGIPLGRESRALLVVSPVGATQIRASRDGREVARAAVADDAALLVVPSTEKLVLEALDAAGRVVGTGPVADTAVGSAESDRGFQLDRWGVD